MCTWADGHCLILTCALVTSPPSPPSALGQESFWGKGTTTSDGQAGAAIRRGLFYRSVCPAGPRHALGCKWFC